MATGPAEFDDETLRAYLAETLPPEAMARVERGLRDSSELRERLEGVRQNRPDASLHTLGAIWKRNRLTCPSRQQLGSYLLEALDPDLGDYLKFHLEVVECPFCRANLADLEDRASRATTATAARHHRIVQSSRHLLSEDRRG